MDDEQFDIDDLVPPGVSEQTGADAELDTVLDQEVLDFLMSANGAVDSDMDDKPPDLDLDEDDEFIFLDTPTDRMWNRQMPCGIAEQSQPMRQEVARKATGF